MDKWVRKGKSFVNVCVSIHHKDLPSGETQEKMMSMTDSFTVYSTEIVVECSIDFIQSVGHSIHANNFSYRAMRGMMNNFRVHSALAAVILCSFSPIDPATHTDSF
jgi:hypothetical protein